MSCRYVICSMDTTVWQQTNEYYVERLGLLMNVCSMGANNAGHIQWPVCQPQTSLGAVTNHRRKLEDQLLNAEVDFSQSLTLFYTKESARSGSDRRPTSQNCSVTFSGRACKWLSSEIVSAGVLGSLELVPVSQMQGYDADNRPSAGARAEQIFVCIGVVADVAFDWC